MSDSYGRLKVDELLNSDGVTFDMVAATTDEATASEKGYMSATDKAKLDGIEASATADQTGAEIKAAYEGEADTNAFTDADHNKLDGIEAGAEVNTVASVAGQTGAVTLAKADVGLGSVDNTADADKPVSSATQTALDAKADLVGGKLNTSQIPDLAVTEFKGVVADQTAMLAVTGEKGDWVNRSDTGQMFIIIGDDPTDANDWAAVSYPASPVVSVAGKTGAVSLIQDDIGSGAVSASTVTAAGLIERTNVQPQSVGTNGFRVSYGSDVSGGYTYLGTRFNGANQAFAHYNGSATTATIGVDGSADFDGKVISGDDPRQATTHIGAALEPDGLVSVRAASNSETIFGGTVSGNSGFTSQIFADGSVIAAGGNFQVDGSGIIQTNIKSAGNVQLDSTASFSSPKITLNAASGTITSTGILTSNRPVSGTPASTWSCFNGQNNGATTSSIKADGSAYFAGNVGVGNSSMFQHFEVGFTDNNTTFQGDGSSGNWGAGSRGILVQNKSTTTNSKSLIQFRTNTADWFAGTELVGSTSNFIFKYENNSPSLTIDSSGRVGIGVEPSVFNGSGDNLVLSSSSHTGLTIDATSSTNSSIHFADGTTGNEAYRGYLVYRHSSDSMEFGTSGSERMRLSGAGDLYIGGTSDANADFVFSTSGSRASFYRNVGIGSANPAARLVVSNDGASGIELQPEITTNTNRITNYNRSASSYNNFRLDAAQHEFLISGSERMRITNDGQLRTLAAQTAFLVSSATGAGTSEYLIGGQYSASSPGLGTNSFRVYTNGNVQNSNNSYGAISDIKLKENIVDASSQWSDIKALRVRNYNFIEGQTHTQIGVVAQEVEAVSPGLVTESPDKDENDNDLGTTTKSVNYSVLYMKAVKALQEAMARIETLEAKVAQLEANN